MGGDHLWEAIGAVGELIGAGAIIVTLIYLAYQVRQARTDASDETRRNRVIGIREIQGWTVNSPAAMRAWSKASGAGWQDLMLRTQSALDLDQEEAELVVTQGAAWVWTHWAQYRSVQSDRDMEELVNIVLAWYTGPPMNILIRDPVFRAWFEPEFLNWLEQTLKERTC